MDQFVLFSTGPMLVNVSDPSQLRCGIFMGWKKGKTVYKTESHTYEDEVVFPIIRECDSGYVYDDVRPYCYCFVSSKLSEEDRRAYLRPKLIQKPVVSHVSRKEIPQRRRPPRDTIDVSLNYVVALFFLAGCLCIASLLGILLS